MTEWLVALNEGISAFVMHHANIYSVYRLYSKLSNYTFVSLAVATFESRMFRRSVRLNTTCSFHITRKTYDWTI